MENLIINESNVSGCLLLTVEGTVNLYTSGDFEKKVYSAIKDNDVILDLSKVISLSSSGIGVLMSAHNDGEDNGHKLYILNPAKDVKMALDTTGFSDVFNIIHSVDEI
ncbi:MULTISPECIES: STAS domain-containing protein [unclassified Treponema]|uniref:STAS domain-containing protein n=1 Tax=unclassified Treponema TaxID=2638727 RepID=UPI0020A3BCBD|nr:MULTISPECIES: STAS domain-containing protein [unclassified Treponema]UTC66508.1 STAS domain-containing protein [Treponema sp. OMZ 789]UTC69240.1 STAS domain-containing protein [Treponema sp. OMZ 790]UTC71953.1 STAS domain-containing protein [Treponema sp. OMZ 791]